MKRNKQIVALELEHYFVETTRFEKLYKKCNKFLFYENRDGPIVIDIRIFGRLFIHAAVCITTMFSF